MSLVKIIYRILCQQYGCARSPNMVSLWYGQDVCLDVNFLKTDYCTLQDDIESL